MKTFTPWQRLPASAIRIIDPEHEARVALAFAIIYVGAAVVTGMIVRAWPLPLWGAAYLTDDATYALGFKVGLLLIVPAVIVKRAGYTLEDLLLGWRASPRSLLTLAVLFLMGVLLNAGLLHGIRGALGTMPPTEAMLRTAFGGLLMFFCAGLPEELVYRWGLQTRLERVWGRPWAIAVTALLFTAWHLPTRYLLATGAEGTAGNLGSVLMGTGLPVLVVAVIFGVAWDRWRNLPALVAIHWGIDTLPSVSSFLKIPMGGH